MLLREDVDEEVRELLVLEEEAGWWACGVGVEEVECTGLWESIGDVVERSGRGDTDGIGEMVSLKSLW